METHQKNKWRKKISFKRVTVCLILASMLMLSFFYANEIEIFLKLQYDYSNFSPHSYEVHFVDVGQGDAVLIRFSNGKTMLVDSGGKSAKNNLFNYIDNVFFRNSDKTFNYVVLTHGDSDHMGNMLDIINNYTVEVFYAPKQRDGINDYLMLADTLANKSATNQLQLRYNQVGEYVVEDLEKVTWLSPIQESYTNNNDYSPIMLVELIDCKIMLTGDATTKGEQEACNYFFETVDIDILKLGHHGSNTSTSMLLLETFTPEIAVVSCSPNNSYNHPSPQTLQRLAQYDQLYNKNLSNYVSTALKGNIIFHINNIGELHTSYLDNVNNYAFISWIYIILPASIILVVVAFIPVRINRQQWKKLKNKANKVKMP